MYMYIYLLPFVLQLSTYFLCFCAIIVCLYGCIQIWKHRASTFVQKRHLPVILGIQISTVGVLASEMAWLTFEMEHYRTDSFDALFISISIAMILFFMWMLLWLLMTR